MIFVVICFLAYTSKLGKFSQFKLIIVYLPPTKNIAQSLVETDPSIYYSQMHRRLFYFTSYFSHTILFRNSLHIHSWIVLTIMKIEVISHPFWETSELAFILHRNCIFLFGYNCPSVFLCSILRMLVLCS